MRSDTVVYKDRTIIVSNPTEFPDLSDSSTGVKEVQEPAVKATIIVPEGLLYLFNLCSCHERLSPQITLVR